MLGLRRVEAAEGDRVPSDVAAIGQDCKRHNTAGLARATILHVVWIALLIARDGSDCAMAIFSAGMRLCLLAVAIFLPSIASAEDDRQSHRKTCRAVYAGIIDDGNGRTSQFYLGATLGTTTTTRRIYDTVAGSENILGNQGPNHLTSLRDRSKVVFSIGSPKYGLELYATDGTPSGTRLLKDIVPGPQSSTPRPLAITNYRYDAVGRSILFQSGGDLWSTNGTPGGTVRLFTPAPPAYLGNWQLLANSGPWALLSASDRTVDGKSIWITDGTKSGTRRLMGRAMRGFETISAGAIGPRRFVFRMVSDLYVTDGTPAGTKKVTTLPYAEGDWHSFPSRKVVLFPAYTAPNGSELWRTDGTAAGTYLINIARDTATDVNGSHPSSFTQLGSYVYFIARGTDGVEGIWRTNGTRAGTRGILTSQEAARYRIDYLFTLHGRLMFGDRTSTHRVDLVRRKVDRTFNEGIFFVVGADITPGRLSHSILALLDFNWRIRFLSKHLNSGAAAVCR
jgi:ELWxxDGT repeat protein